MSLDNLTAVTPETLLGQVAARLAGGYRFVTISCTDTGDTFDVLYHFDLKLRLENLRMALPKGAPLPSISSLYFAAALVENEIQDLFGIRVEGLALNYEGKFILSEGAPKSPFCKISVVRPADAGAPAGAAAPSKGAT
jgi:ech hydrogenase subunit D